MIPGKTIPRMTNNKVPLNESTVTNKGTSSTNNATHNTAVVRIITRFQQTPEKQKKKKYFCEAL